MNSGNSDTALSAMPTIQQTSDSIPPTDLSRDTTRQPGHLTIAQLMTQRGISGGVALEGEAASAAAAYLATNDPRKYQVGDMLARGGMGEILHAKDLNCRRRVAMKVLGEGAKATNDQVLRFIVEAQITAQLEHPSIVPVYELGVDSGGDVYYTMKLLRGHTLVDILIDIKRGIPETLEKYPLNKLLNMFIKICDAVAYAHAKGVIHRDLKPENVMIGDYGEVLLMDWGLAKMIRKPGEPDVPENESATLSTDEYVASTPNDQIESILSEDGIASSFKTMDGQIMGTPGFMPPEQAMGQANLVDERSDVYALGGILYNILTLQPSVTGRYIQKMVRMIIKGDIKPPVAFNDTQQFPHCPNGKIPYVLSAIAMKALATKREARYLSVGELQHDVDKHLSGYATSVEEPGLFNLLVLLVKRHRMECIWLGVTTMILIAVITGFMMKIVEAKKQAEENLMMFLQEKDVRREISKKLVTTAMQAIAPLNPEQKNINVRHVIRGDEIDLHLQDNPRLVDIRPLQDLPLTRLNLDNTAVHDLAVVRTIPLNWLSIANTKVKNVDILKEKRLTLKWLNLSGTEVDRIDGLSALKLTYLDISRTKVADLSPLKGMNLETLIISEIPLTDISIIKDMKLKTLGIDTRQLGNPEGIGQAGLECIMIANPSLADLKFLARLPLKALQISGKGVTDISVLRGTTLERLVLKDTGIRDISDLANSTIHSLTIEGSKVRDINVIKSLKLTELILDRCYFLQDVKPVTQCPTLERLLIPPHITEIGFLHQHPNLKTLAYSMAEYENNQSLADFFAKTQVK